MPTANGSTEGMSERHAMLQTMAEMQDAHNTLVHEQWRTQGYEYYRAMWVECAEMHHLCDLLGLQQTTHGLHVEHHLLKIRVCP